VIALISTLRFARHSISFPQVRDAEVWKGFW